jgi:predicted ATPase
MKQHSTKIVLPQHTRSLLPFSSIEFERIAVLTGENGAGKSHLLRAIADGDALITINGNQITRNEIFLIQTSDIISQEEKEFDIGACIRKGSSALDRLQKMKKYWDCSRESEYQQLIRGSEIFQNTDEKSARYALIFGSKDLFESIHSEFIGRGDYVEASWERVVEFRKKCWPHRAAAWRLGTDPDRSEYSDSQKETYELDRKIAEYCLKYHVDLEDITSADMTVMELEEAGVLPSSKILLDNQVRTLSRLMLTSHVVTRCATEIAAQQPVALNSVRRAQVQGLHDFMRASLESPIDMADRLLQSLTSFPYYLVRPLENASQYELNFQSRHSGELFRLSQLSSGERAIFSLLSMVVQSYCSREARLILLDEADATLHPSFVHGFVEFVEVLACPPIAAHIIIATHAPQTVAALRGAEWFVMRRGISGAAKVSRNVALDELTCRLFTVRERSKIVLVENVSDALFYSVVRSHYNARLAHRGLRVQKDIRFVRNKAANMGGRRVVEEWIKRIEDTPLGEDILGLCDRDSGPSKDASKIIYTKRYCRENYLIDPLVIYACLAEHKALPADWPILDLDLRTLDQQELQRCCDVVSYVLDAAIKMEENMKFRGYTDVINERVISYPLWISDFSGKDIIHRLKVAGLGVCSPENLKNIIDINGWIPESLLEVFDSIDNDY